MKLVGNAFLAAGDADSIDAVLELLRREGIETEGNPDIFARAYAHFGVDDARELRERANLSALGDRRVFVVAVSVITTEAQNALLKTLEDAPGDALFFLIVPNPGTLLSTVRSRSQVIDLGTGERAEQLDSGAFLAAQPQKRIDMMKALLEKGDDDRRDISAIVAFLSSLEREIGKRDNTSGLDAIYRARKYLSDKGALVKPLLEQVALLVPVMKT